MLVLARVIDSLRHLGLGNFIGVHAAHADALLMDEQHDLGRFFAILLNDMLQHIFQKNREEATQIMLHVHQKGVGICGVYTYEVAETKVTQTVDYARKNQHPLQCTLEKE